MLLHLLTFNTDINVSLQIGDIVYYSPVTTAPLSGFSTINAIGSIVTFGVVTAIYNNGSVTPPIAPHSIMVMYDDAAGILPPGLNDYIMFSKNKEANSSSLTGYYADISFENYSTNKIELFAVGSEVSESSK